VSRHCPNPKIVRHYVSENGDILAEKDYICNNFHLPIVQNAESMSTDSELVLSSQQGMFLISTTPLKIHSCMLEYTTFTFARHACRYLSSGVNEVHIVFDDLG
jgi:hypothetical protein